MKLNSELRKCLVAFLTVLLTSTCFAYDLVGHRIVAEVAYANLTKKAKKQVDKTLYPRGIVYESSWADEIKSDKSYAYSYQWHYQNLNDSMPLSRIQELLDQPKMEGEYLFNAIEQKVQDLKTNTNDIEALKFLVHFVGDLHQPMHLGRLADLGGNKIEIKWFGKTINLHSLWDGYLIESTRMSSSEYCEYLECKYSSKKAEWINNSLLQTIDYVYVVRQDIYKYDYSDVNNYHYLYRFADVQDELLYRAGLQLASILNKTFR